MDLSNLSRGRAKRPNKKRIGRGPSSGTGKTSGKGHKGQKARSGYSRRAGFEGGQTPLARRFPKRGFRHQNRHECAGINVDVLDAAFEDGAEVNADIVVSRGLAKKMNGGIKILGRGELTKKLIITAAAASAGAQTKVEAAGGSLQVLVAPVSRAVKRRNSSRKDR